MLSKFYIYNLIIIALFLRLPDAGATEPVLLSSEGSGRATAYLESPKIVTYEGRTHVAWLDSPEEGFRIRIRTMDHKSGNWSDPYTIGEAVDNHGGPALTIDGEGYLHVVYFSHHHPFRYSRSKRPNDASEWTDYDEFGVDLTYPALVCAKDGTLLLTARRSYKEKPWELEMWSKAPDGDWQRERALLSSRHLIYSQFAASLAWGADHETLHLGARIYEMPADELESPLTSVVYMKSPDGGRTWVGSDGSPIALPATADTIDSIASGQGIEGRILNAGSIALGPDDVVYVPYSVRTEDSCQAYLATPYGNGKWRHQHLNTFLPDSIRNWDLFMHGGISFGSKGEAIVTAVAMHVDPVLPDWGDPSSEVISFHAKKGEGTFTGKMEGKPDPTTPRWMPNMERPTGFNEMPEYPSFVYTTGVRGDGVGDQLSNQVWWVPGGK